MIRCPLLHFILNGIFFENFADAVYRPSSGNLKKYSLVNYTDAVCLDGSPAVYYYELAQNDTSKPPAHRQRWVMFFQGGGWCYDKMDCYHRSNTSLGSSKNYAPTTQCPAEMYDSPGTPFAGYNRVWVPYCDGNSFSGNRKDPVVVNGKSLYFRGHAILQAILDDLVANHDLTSATHFALMGCSAGGLAAYIHTNFVGDYLHQHAKGLVRYGSIPVSGYFLNHPNSLGKNVYAIQMQNIALLSDSKGGLDQQCVQAAGSDWTRCIFANETYAHVKYQIFPINSYFDSWQTGCILGAVLPTSFPNQTGPENGVCEQTTTTWSVCQNNYPNNCTAADKAAFDQWTPDFTAAFQSVSTYKKPGNGAFIYNRHSHCAPNGVDGWNGKHFSINGTTAAVAVTDWWLSPSTATNNTHYCVNPPSYKYGC